MNDNLAAGELIVIANQELNGKDFPSYMHP